MTVDDDDDGASAKACWCKAHKCGKSHKAFNTTSHRGGQDLLKQGFSSWGPGTPSGPQGRIWVMF